ncbi:LuxR family transcriptional regulator [Lentzea sp. NBRC 105346]|uniref:helix-turn-helix transcriptional regulator n=1 Tax=Lentzea sp. NBRC 105346 TaxID=3032205 RepID=UPI0024A1FA5E|nr:LuxR C-terminal-related transcriptional regulator [Lentzea sp. NBRC 105346]GLZ28203.1 LuxR family transcriptional regulator [Lentzea sp. NBRC 105346]
MSDNAMPRSQRQLAPSASALRLGEGSADPAEAGNLPAEISSFVGRDRLLSELEDRRDAGRRLITLTGPAGVGKTRAARQFGDRCRSARLFRDGVWLVSLAGLREPDLLGRAVADAIGVVDNTSGSGFAHLADALRDKHLLLILDNCEHLLEPAQQLASALLRGCGDVTVLVTSQERLGVAGEHIVRVPPLCVCGEGDCGEGTGRDGLGEAARLLVDRAEAAGVPIAEADYPLAIELCALLDGLPLAIELAAVRLGELSVREILSQLAVEREDDRDRDGRFALLVDGDPAGRRAHQTLRRALEWSAARCSPAERELWARLSVFPADFERVAVEAVCTGDGIDRGEVLDLLGGLVRKSILVSATSSVSRRVRYRMLQSIRLFGAELVQEPCRRALQQSHADYYRQLLADAAQDWLSPREVALMRGLHEEWHNIRGAIGFYLSQPDQIASGAQMAIDGGRTRFAIFSGSLGQYRHLLQQAFEAEGQSPPLVLGAAALGAWIALIQGDQDVAVPYLARAREVADGLGVRDVAAPLLYTEGARLLFATRDPEQAKQSLPLLVRAAQISRRDGYAGDTQMMTLFVAVAACFYGDRDTARSAVDDVTATTEAHRSAWSHSWSLWVQGLFELTHGGDLRGGYRVVQQALAMQRDMGDRWGPVWSVWLLACLAARLGLFEHSAQLFGGAHREQKAIHVIGDGLIPLARVEEQAERLTRRRLGSDVHAAHYEIGVEMGFQQVVSMALTELPDVDAGRARLSAREYEIAGYAAQGLTNKQIAARLVVSHRTVDGHMSNILRTLGVSRRSGIGATYREYRPLDADDPADDHDRRAAAR